jgi:hypothetical protein
LSRLLRKLLLAAFAVLFLRPFALGLALRFRLPLRFGGGPRRLGLPRRLCLLRRPLALHGLRWLLFLRPRPLFGLPGYARLRLRRALSRSGRLLLRP